MLLSGLRFLLTLSLFIITIEAHSSRVVRSISMPTNKCGLSLKSYIIASPAQAQRIMFALSVHATCILSVFLSYIFLLWLLKEASRSYIFEIDLLNFFYFYLLFLYFQSLFHLVDHNSFPVIHEIKTDLFFFQYTHSLSSLFKSFPRLLKKLIYSIDAW